MKQKLVHFYKKTPRNVKLILLCLLVLAILGIGVRIVNYIRLYYATKQQAVLTVATIKATQGPTHREIILPGNVQAWHETTINARTDGYVIHWMVDIGTAVKTGDLLAEISTPEVNAQLQQAEAELKTAEANNNLAQITATRWKNLLKTDSVSKQEADEKISNAQATVATVNAARANRDRLLDLVSFERIIAPFDGVIMSRTTDIGRLINAGSGTMPLFRLVQSNPLRVYVNVPEFFSKNILPGLTAQLYFPQYPGKSYTATLLNTAKAIDANTRTLLVQLQVNNDKNELFAGSYTEVHFRLPANNSVILPVNTLIFRSQGLQVATLSSDSKAIIKPIIIGQDFGDTVEVVSGIKANESIIINPSDSLLNNQTVRVISSNKATKGIKNHA